jgi:hypothetical protein
LKRVIAVPVLCLLAFLFSGLSAQAAAPTRIPAPVPDPRFFSCGEFQLMANFPANQEYALIFNRADGSTRVIITGRLVVKFTNLTNPNNTLTANISGPSFDTFYPDGSEIVMNVGLQFAGTVVAGRALVTIYADGRVTFSMSGHTLVDVCSALA